MGEFATKSQSHHRIGLEDNREKRKWGGEGQGREEVGSSTPAFWNLCLPQPGLLPDLLCPSRLGH